MLTICGANPSEIAAGSEVKLRSEVKDWEDETVPTELITVASAEAA